MNLFYDSGKRFSKSGQVRIKGVPYVNPDKKRIKEERAARKATQKAMKKGKSE